MCGGSTFTRFPVSPSHSQQFIWFKGCKEKDRSVQWKKLELEPSVRADCNEAPRGPVRPETKDPAGVLHTRRGEVPILLSSPSGFDTLSGSVLLLATDQYVLFSSSLVSLSPSLWGNVEKWQSSIKQLCPPPVHPQLPGRRLF